MRSLPFLLLAGLALALMAAGNASAELEDMAGHWSFDEGEGTTAYDSSGNSNDGTLENGPQWVDGIDGGALEFDGGDDYVDVENAQIGSDNFTISFWYKKENYDKINEGSYFENVVTNGDGDSGGSMALRFRDYYDDLPDIRCMVYTSDGKKWVGADVEDYVSVWTHVACTYSSIAGMSLYINGEKVAHLVDTAYIDYTNKLYLGGVPEGWGDGHVRSLEGELDDLIIWDGVLSSEEISALYECYTSSAFYECYTSLSIIDSISPNPVKQDYQVTFSGHGNPDNETFIRYVWHSSIDGELHNGTEANFTIPASQLTQGGHTIYFKVQNESGNWSKESSRTLTILPPNQSPSSSIESSVPNAVMWGVGTFSLEDMESSPSGTLKNSATYDSTNKWVRLTPATSSRSGQLEYIMNPSNYFVAEFEFRAGGGTGADATWLYAYCTRTPTEEMDSCGGGYHFVYDEYTNEIQLYYSGSKLKSVSQSGIDNNQWHDAKIIHDGAVIKIYFDGNLVIDYQDTSRTKTGDLFGWAARNGGSNNNHDIRNLRLAYGGYFTGSASDSDGAVVAYEWSSSLDGFLSDQSSFILGSLLLSVGNHTITFRAQDNDGNWSEYATTWIEVLPDSDGDGIGDSEDAFPNDASESADTDGDGVGDNSDAFPNDLTASVDSDGDGYPDSWNFGITSSSLYLDLFPSDPTEWRDTDADGVGDNGDSFPDNLHEWADTDRDGTGDNSDAFPNDPDEQFDTDGDGVGDNSDSFPNTALFKSWWGPGLIIFAIIGGASVFVVASENKATLAEAEQILEELENKGGDITPARKLIDEAGIWRPTWLAEEARDKAKEISFEHNQIQEEIDEVYKMLKGFDWGGWHHLEKAFDTLEKAQTALSEGKFEEAWERLASAKSIGSKLKEEYGESMKRIDQVRAKIAEFKKKGVNTDELEKILKKAEKGVKK